MIPFTPDERRAQFAPSQNPGGPVDPDVLAVLGQPAQEPAVAQPTMNQQVDPDVLDIVNRDQIPLMSSLMSASRVNPDQAAEASRLGARIGVGQDVALRNLDEVRQRAFMADMQARDIARTNPVLASFLMDRNFSQQASDDVGVLDGLKNVFMDIGRGSIGMPMTYIPGELARGYMRGQRVAERGEIGLKATFGEDAQSDYDRARQLQEEMRTLGKPGFLSSAAEMVAQNVAGMREVAATTLIGGAAGTVIPVLGTAAGMGIGFATGTAATTARMEAGNLYLDLIEQGVSEDAAVPAALAGGLINGAIEAVGAKIATAPFKSLLSKVVRERMAEAVTRPTIRAALTQAGKSYVLQVGSEAAEEGAQELTNIVSEEMAKWSDGIKSETTLRKAVDRIIDATAQGAMGAAIIGGIGPGANLAIDLKRAQRAGRQTKFFESLTQNATESKVRGRDAGAYERFVAAQAAGTNAETVFVDGATMRGVLEQAAVTDSQLDAVVPGLAQKVRDAATTGSDVTIPTAQYAARLAGTDLGNALLPHMRLAPDAISATEAQAVEASRAEIVAQAERLMEEKQTVDAAFVQSAQAVEDSIFNAVKAVGYSDVQARTYAKIHQAMAVVDAAAMGITPEEYNRKYPPTIVGEGMPVQAMEQAARIDSDYLAAVERGDMATAQRMVDEAAMAGGYTVKAFHGTDAQPFDIFGNYDAYNFGDASYFSPDRKYAEDYAYSQRTGGGTPRVLNVALKLGRVFSPETNKQHLALYKKWAKEQPAVHGYFAVQGPIAKPYGPKGVRNLISWEDQWWLVTKIREAGFDSFTTSESDAETIAYGILNANQIKLADPVTRDEAGNVVPLSRRFDITSPRIFEQAAAGIDADYMAAVKRGDMATAQRMVDEAAKAAGYNETGFHGLGEGVLEGSTFDVNRRGKKTGAKSAKMGFFFASQKTAETYAAQVPVDSELRQISRAAARVAREFIDSIPVKYREQIRPTLSILQEQLDRGEEAFMPDGDLYNVDINSPASFVGQVMDDLYESFPELIEDVLDVWPGDSKAKREWASKTRLKYLREFDPELARLFKEGKGQKPVLFDAKLKMQNPLIVDFKGKETRPETYADIIRRAIKNGHDSAIIRNTYDTMRGEPVLDDIKVVFDPAQIKSAEPVTRDEQGNVVPLSRRFDITSPRIFEQAAMLEQAPVSAGFYSALAKAVDAIDAKSIAPSGWKERIKGLVNKGEIKQEELTWSGLEDFLALPRDGKVTKAEVAAFLKNNGVQVQTVTLGAAERDVAVFAQMETGLASARLDLESAGGMTPELADAFDAYESLLENQVTDREQTAALQDQIDAALTENGLSELHGYFEDSSAAQDESIRGPKYEQYTLPGGTNYREVLITLPQIAPSKQIFRKQYQLYENGQLVAVGPDAVSAVRWREQNPNADIRVVDVPDIQATKRQAAGSGAFVSQHWDQPNVLVHFRLNDRVDADGKRVLFVEEIQSDWGQAGRKKGFASPMLSTLPAGTKLYEPGTSPYDAKMAVVELPAGIGGRSLFYGNTIEEAKANALAFTKPGAVPLAPFVENTDGWLNLGLKHIMLEATQGNYDRVAFVNGKQSADRYDLSNQIDSIVYRKNDDGTYDVEAIKDSSVLVTKKNQQASQIEELIGKEITQRIVKGDGEQPADYPGEYKELSGLDLKVGGEGMRNFYDKIVPAAVNKLLKKYGGGKLETANIRLATMATRDELTQSVYGRNETYETLPENAKKSIDEVMRRGGSSQPAFSVTPEMVKRLESGLPLFQAMPAGGPARGGFDPRRLTTIINKGADVTTLFHELIHYKVEVYLRIASAPDAPARIKADLDELFKFMGVAGATFEERLATYNGLTFEQRRPLEEKITYNFEDYLLEGKAPSVEMRGVFDRIAAWMRRIYKSLRDDLNAIYKREFGTDLPILTPEIRAVFDRMLASKEQIKRAEAVNNMKGLFQTQAESGMDDATWAAYQVMQQEATDEAIAALTADTMKQVEWMSNARSKKLKELQKAHDTQRKEVRDQVMAEVRQEPIYRAMEYLKRGTLIGPDGSEATVEGVHKINTALAREFVPGLDMAKMGRGKYGYLAEDGLHPDIVAEMFGFPAGSALLQALADAKPMREVVDAKTDEIMVRDYSEMGDPKAQEAAVNRAIHNEARARLVAVEARWLSKATQPVRVIQEAARQAAVDAVGNTVIRNLRPDQYTAAEARASRDAIEAARGADTKRLRDRYGAGATREQIMLQAKRQQLYQNALATETQKADDAIQKGLKYLRRVLRDSNRQRMGADYADQIAGILDRFELAPISRAEAARRADLAAWVEAKRAEGLEPDIDPEVLAESNRRPWRNLTVTEFNAVMDAVKQIEFMGKNERKIKLAAEKADFEKVRDEIVASVVANAGDRKANTRTATTNIGRAITTLKGFIGAHLKAASIARILDGAKDGGPVWNYLIRSANDAGDKETTMRAQATERLTAMFAPIFKLGKMGGKGQYFPTVDRSFNREARLVIALNMGNDGNIQRLLDGEGWSIEQITPILQSLTEEEWNLVQQVWDYFETYRPEIAAKERELYGKEPNWVEPKPLIVQTADGKTVTLRGGYYPIKYDPRASMRAETMSDAEAAKRDLAGAFTSATTRRSYTKSRVKEVKGRPLLYTLAGMYGGVNEVIHDLSWHRWLIQANRLMRSQAFDEAVRERYGPEFIGQLKTWIKDVAAGERGVQNEAEMALNFLRQGISSAGLGFNVVSAALQITGFNQSIVRVGVKWIGRGIAAVAQSPLLSMKMVNEKSDFMENRSRTQFRELNELRNMVQGDSVAMRRIKMGTYFLMMRMQRMVDVPTWIGAYEKALYEGRDEDTSIALADQAVIDSQGGGMLKDLSRVERGGAGLKLFTVFYGYMNTVYNMAAVQTMTAKNKGKLAADYAMLFVVPVVLGQLIRKAMVPKTDDEPEDLEAIARKLAAEQLSYLMGTMVIVREFGEISKIVAGAEGPRMGYGGPAGLRAVGETYNFATQASQGEFDKAFRKSAVNLIGAFTGLPSAQINRTLDGLDALYEGETENVLAPATGVRR